MEPSKEVSNSIQHAINKAGDRLRHACEDHDLRGVHALLSAGAPVDHRLKAKGGEREDVKAGVCPGTTPLLSACKSTLAPERIRTHTNIVKALLDAGGDCDVLDDEGTSPLMVAAENGLAETVWLLLQSGATIDLKNKDGATAVHLAKNSPGSNEETASTIERWLANPNGFEAFRPHDPDVVDEVYPDAPSAASDAPATPIKQPSAEPSPAEGEKVTQEQYQWAVTTGEILQQMPADERAEAWSVMSTHERTVYNRVMQGRCMLLAQQLASMTPDEQTGYWAKIPADMRAQYEQVLSESKAGTGGAGMAINLSEEQQALEQRRWGDRREREERQQQQRLQQESENRLFELDVVSRRDTHNSPTTTARSDNSSRLPNLSPAGWSNTSGELDGQLDSPPRIGVAGAGAGVGGEAGLGTGTIDMSLVDVGGRGNQEAPPSSPQAAGKSLADLALGDVQSGTINMSA